MPKPFTPILFTRIGVNLYQCASQSDSRIRYNVGVIGEGQAMCVCRGSVQRGPNSCKHAKQLVDQGLAHLNAPGFDVRTAHPVTIRDDVPGTNFRVECACGWASNIATLDREYVEARGREHVYAYSEESIEKRRKALWS